MVNCAKCWRKLGLFEKKFNYKDKNGNPIKYCSECNEKNQSIKYSISKIDKINKLKKNFLIKNKKRMNYLKKKKAPLVSDFCQKYLSTKDLDFKSTILAIYKNKEIFGLIEEDDLDFLKEHFIKVYQETQDHSPSTSEEYDEVMSLETICNHVKQLIQDVIKLGKLLEKITSKLITFKL